MPTSPGTAREKRAASLLGQPWGDSVHPSGQQVRPRSPKPWRQASTWGSGWGRGERRRRGETPGANGASIRVTGG